MTDLEAGTVRDTNLSITNLLKFRLPALYAKGPLDEAIASYLTASRLNPYDASVYTGLGNALRAKGLLDDAEEAFAQARALEQQ